jgi:hypothetical protein
LDRSATKRIGRTSPRANADIMTRIARGIGLRIGEQTAWMTREVAPWRVLASTTSAT